MVSTSISPSDSLSLFCDFVQVLKSRFSGLSWAVLACRVGLSLYEFYQLGHLLFYSISFSSCLLSFCTFICFICKLLFIWKGWSLSYFIDPFLYLLVEVCWCPCVYFEFSSLLLLIFCLSLLVGNPWDPRKTPKCLNEGISYSRIRGVVGEVLVFSLFVLAAWAILPEINPKFLRSRFVFCFELFHGLTRLPLVTPDSTVFRLVFKTFEVFV